MADVEEAPKPVQVEDEIDDEVGNGQSQHLEDDVAEGLDNTPEDENPPNADDDDDDEAFASDADTLVPEVEISHDSELMTLHVAAVPVPSSRQFSTHNDEFGKPFIISSGTDGHLYVIKESDETGQRKLVDLSDAFGLDPKDDDVLSFEGVQDPEDDRIFLTFVTTDEKGQTSLHICRPFHPVSIDVDEKLDLRELLIPHKNENKRITLSKVWIGPKTPEFHYPEIVVAYKSPAEINGASDVARVKVTENFSSFEVMSDFEIPEDASGVDDIVPATTPVGRGYFCLYTLQGKKRLIFATTDKLNGYGFKVPLTCPEQARALATYRDPATGKSCLVVGADGLFVWDPYQSVQQGHAGRQITQGDDFFDVTQLHVTQQGTILSVFATNDAQGVIYGHSKDLEFQEPLRAVPLVPDFAGGCFSPFVAADGNTQQVLIAGKGGTMSLLEQDGVSLAWKNQPFYIPNLGENIEYPGYMVNIVVSAKETERPMIHTVFRLRSSGYDSIIVNGRSMSIGPEGVLVRTDEVGSINLLIASDDIACDVYYLENPDDEDYPDVLAPGEVITIDPAEKVWKRLEQIKNGKDLKNFRTSSGKPLDSAGKLSDRDLEEIAAAIGQAASERGKMVENGNFMDEASNFGGPGGGDGEIGSFPITKDAIKDVDSFKDAIQLGLDGLQWLIRKAKQFVKFAVRKTVEGLDILLQTTDNKFFRFCINGLKSAAKFIGAVLEGFLDVLDKVVDFVGYLMDWEGAKKMQKSIMHTTNQFLSLGPPMLSGIAEQADGFFDDLKASFKGKAYPLDALAAERPKDKGDEKAAAQKRKASAADSYTDYQMRHGGGNEGAQEEGEAEDGGDQVAARNGAASDGPVGDGIKGDDTVTAVVKDLIWPLLCSIGDLVVDFVENIRLLFNKHDNLDAGEVFQKMGADLVLGLLDIFQKLIVGVLKVIGAIMQDFVDGLNKKIWIPVISPLWKKMTGSELTVLSALSLLVAIPANALMKTFFGDHVDVDMSKDNSLAEHIKIVGEQNLQQQKRDDDDDDEDDDDDDVPEGASITSLAQSQLGAFAELSMVRSGLASPPLTPRSSMIAAQASRASREINGAPNNGAPAASRQEASSPTSASDLAAMNGANRLSMSLKALPTLQVGQGSPNMRQMLAARPGASAAAGVAVAVAVDSIVAPPLDFSRRIALKDVVGRSVPQLGATPRPVVIAGVDDEAADAPVFSADLAHAQPLALREHGPFQPGSLSPIEGVDSASESDSGSVFLESPTEGTLLGPTAAATATATAPSASGAGAVRSAATGTTANGSKPEPGEAPDETPDETDENVNGEEDVDAGDGTGEDGCDGSEDCGCPDNDPSDLGETEGVLKDALGGLAERQKYQAGVSLALRLAIMVCKIGFAVTGETFAVPKLKPTSRRDAKTATMTENFPAMEKHIDAMKAHNQAAAARNAIMAENLTRAEQGLPAKPLPAVPPAPADPTLKPLPKEPKYNAPFFKKWDVNFSLMLAGLTIPYYNVGGTRMPRNSDDNATRREQLHKYHTCCKRGKDRLTPAQADTKVEEFRQEREHLCKIRNLRFANWTCRTLSPMFGYLIRRLPDMLPFDDMGKKVKIPPQVGAAKDIFFSTVAFAIKAAELGVDCENMDKGVRRRRWTAQVSGWLGILGFSAVTIGKGEPVSTVGGMILGVAGSSTAMGVQFRNTRLAIKGEQEFNDDTP